MVVVLMPALCQPDSLKVTHCKNCLHLSGMLFTVFLWGMMSVTYMRKVSPLMRKATDNNRFQPKLKYVPQNNL